MIADTLTTKRNGHAPRIGRTSTRQVAKSERTYYAEVAILSPYAPLSPARSHDGEQAGRVWLASLIADELAREADLLTQEAAYALASVGCTYAVATVALAEATADHARVRARLAKERLERAIALGSSPVLPPSPLPLRSWTIQEQKERLISYLPDSIGVLTQTAFDNASQGGRQDWLTAASDHTPSQGSDEGIELIDESKALASAFSAVEEAFALLVYSPLHRDVYGRCDEKATCSPIQGLEIEWGDCPQWNLDSAEMLNRLSLRLGIPVDRLPSLLDSWQELSPELRGTIDEAIDAVDIWVEEQPFTLALAGMTVHALAEKEAAYIEEEEDERENEPEPEKTPHGTARQARRHPVDRDSLPSLTLRLRDGTLTAVQPA